MNRLELRIPPPVVLAAIALAMWAVRETGPVLELSEALRRGLAGAIALAGLGIDAASVLSFLRARTTVNPLHPERAAALVTSGAFRFSRNPMYAGQLLLLAGWAVLLSSAWTLAGPVAFVLYLNRFQIGPEERMLQDRFGAAYSDYRARVRRWL